MIIKVRILVVEPWDFNAGDGTASFTALIDANQSGYVHLSDGRAIPGLLATCDRPVTFQHTTFRNLLLTPRQKITRDLFDALACGENIPFSASWREDGMRWDVESAFGRQDWKAKPGGFLVVDVTRIT